MHAWNDAYGTYGNDCRVWLLDPTFNANPQGPSFTSYNLDFVKASNTGVNGGDATWSGTAYYRTYSLVRMNPSTIDIGSPSDAFFQHIAAHELGHTFGLDDCPSCICSTLMTYQSYCNSSPTLGPTSCDNQLVQYYGDCGPISGGTCDQLPPVSGCPGTSEWSWDSCSCVTTYSPIVVDTLGNGFDLTDAAGGVNFDLDSDGTPEHLSWTTANSDDASSPSTAMAT
jgi:hypothetical protein